ncbi:RiPP maturation radical SAM C-methyltransferase [Mesorhizobium sp. M0306]|uniref:RiPP maturation radical SAM C-methyltransferase n=1 Tax=unclassified Mesorhizobium TaxID=325217 RepID=UPI0033367DB0
MRTSTTTVALVTMPFASIGPSLQVGLLKAAARKAGFEVDGFHLNIDFACQLGLEQYETLAEHRGILLGEWLFAAAAFRDQAPLAGDRFIHEFRAELADVATEIGMPTAELARLRDVAVPAYLDRLMAVVDWTRFDVVGFSSTFQQNTASFALARRIKEAHPGAIIVFGGANFDGDMGLAWLEAIHWIDFAIAGEADEAFPRFLAALADGGDPLSVPGVLGRLRGRAVQQAGRGFVSNLDQVPLADFSDYIARARTLVTEPPLETVRPALPFESSRGCWWGQRHHCTFCGLNGQSMGFRSKSADRILAELAHYSREFGALRFEATDNILDHRYFDSVLAALAEAGAPYDLFYEVKSNLDRTDIARLLAAGVTSIQPGIESLSSAVLKLMRKGVRGIDNVNALRWARYYGLDVSWNILFGFPEERQKDYDAQFEILRRLGHLQPPIGASRIWLERFSPLYQVARADPACRVRPEASYAYVYPASCDLDRIAYFFDWDAPATLPDESHAAMQRWVCRWQKAWRRGGSSLVFWAEAADRVIVYDRRFGRKAREHLLEGLAAELHTWCSERPESAARLRKRLPASSASAILDGLSGLVDAELMIQENDLFLTLALPHRQPEIMEAGLCAESASR